MALDPAEFLDGWADGDVESGNPGGGPFGQDVPEVPNRPDRQPNIYQVFDVAALAPGPPAATATCRADSRPDYWLVALDSTAGSGVAVYQGSGAGGVPIRLGPSGRARIPAQSTQESLTLLQTGASASNVTVIAVRGLSAELVRAG